MIAQTPSPDFSLRGLAKRILPLSNPAFISMRRRLSDLRTLSLSLNPAKKKQVRAAFDRCQTSQDFFDFARMYLQGGAMQHPEEIFPAIDYMRTGKPRCICEIGTAYAGTNLLLSHMLETVETIIAVDLYIMNGAYLRLLRRPTQQIHFINGSSYAPQTFERVKSALAGRKIDMLFIDGDHRYDGVKRDFELYTQLMRDGGLIMFHDIVRDHRTRFGRPTARWVGDVPRFWSELKAHYRHREFIREPDQDGLGLGILHWTPNENGSGAS